MVGSAEPRPRRALHSTAALRPLPADRLGRSAAGIALAVVFGLALPLVAAPARAADQTSASHRHRAGTFAAIGVARLPSAASEPRHLGSLVTLGASVEVAPSGRPDSLRAVLPGFLWIEAGRSDLLDLDGDGAAWFLDADDDGDGLLDVHETGTGTYVSPQNTGTSGVNADSDGDGFSDGAEVAGGTDPTDPGSRPGAAAVPLLSGLARLLLAVLLLRAGSNGLASRTPGPTRRRST